MKTRVIALVGLVASILLIASVAMAEDGIAKANVPFSFAIGNKTLPAGNYEIFKMDVPMPVYCLRSLDGPQAIFFWAEHRDPRNNGDSQFVWVFDHVGDTNFLSTIWLGSGENGLQLQKSKHERELMAMGETQSTIQVAETLR